MSSRWYIWARMKLRRALDWRSLTSSSARRMYCHAFLVLLLRQAAFRHGHVEHAFDLLAQVVALGLAGQLLQQRLGIVVLALLRHAARQQHLGLVGLLRAAVLADYQTAGVVRGAVVLLVEGAVGGQQVAVLDVAHPLLAFLVDAVFLYALQPLLYGGGPCRSSRSAPVPRAQLVHGEYLGVVVLCRLCSFTRLFSCSRCRSTTRL